ncbi:M17 family metallopeptidase [Shewanella sedimentimangrovi]|uniref:Leucyl aminopeptidase family protein n=1 Tax=Shewanella sedimentimangrovi TaxID=2814293 RepID=A0ABX7QZB9_9GAMM|nr:leucyl aminopeptidase family protein [Shewanella sedimentimangrovi]QSX36266.1 leucyl aminopeptidase family protein [Shewanella sedimentimangrovi]
MFAANFVDVSDKEAIFDDANWDAVLVLSQSLAEIEIEEIALLASHGATVDRRVGKSATLLFAPGLAGGRLIISPIKATAGDYEDVRSVAEAARTAIAIARDAGAKRPLLLVANSAYAKALEVAALGCGQELWQPLESREAGGEPCAIEAIGLLQSDTAALLNALEAGRNLARDLCGTEPERMAAPAFADYCLNAFKGSGIQVSVVEHRDELERDYPLLCAVGRASFAVARHQPRVVKLEYLGEGDTQRTLLFAGKGVVYDTGGADLKIAGAMAGMSRDKGGAAAVAGLFKTLSLLKPKGIRVMAELGLVRNSIGSEAFVTDEIIQSHAGVRVRIGNTDAEGRLVLADLLSHLRLKALTAVAPELFSVATLTGHVVRVYGGYTAAVANAVAHKAGVDQKLSAIAEEHGEALEVSRLRREDFGKIREVSGAADVLSSNNAPSSVTARGHQYPAAFLLKASGLAEHDLSSNKPLPYVHLDIAGSATEGDPLYGKPTAAPLVTLCHYITM